MCAGGGGGGGGRGVSKGREEVGGGKGGGLLTKLLSDCRGTSSLHPALCNFSPDVVADTCDFSVHL